MPAARPPTASGWRSSPSRTRPAAGSRPAGTGCATCSPSIPASYCPDQYNNPDNVDAYAGLAHELLAQLPHIDVLVCRVGTGGHSAGISSVLRRHFPDLQLVGVDTVGSTIFGQPARPRLMRGLGSSIHPRNVAYDAFNEVHWVAPAEAVWACRTLAARHYVTGGWSTGAVTLVARWLARTTAGPDHRRRLPRRAVAILEHRLRRRLLPAPTACSGRSRPTSRTCCARRPSGRCTAGRAAPA